MKNYIAPEMEITKFGAADIVTTSGSVLDEIVAASAPAELNADGAVRWSNSQGEF